MLMIAAVAELDHALGALAGAEKNAREVDVDHGLPLCEAHLADDRAVLDLDEQGVLGDARVVDQDVEAAEGRDDRIERPDDLLLARDVDDGGRDPRRRTRARPVSTRGPTDSGREVRCLLRAAKAVAMALPMPRPPVTATTLSFNCI